MFVVRYIRAVLGVAVCAVLPGARSYASTSRWTADLTSTARLGLGRGPPCESTTRRVLQAVHPASLDQAIVTWLATASSAGTSTRQPRRVIALDGKSALD